MPLQVIIALILTVLLTIVSRFIAENAIKLLSAEDRVKLSDGLSKLRKIDLIAVSVLMVSFLIILYFQPPFLLKACIIFVSLFLLYIIGFCFVTNRKLIQFNFSQLFRKRYSLSVNIYCLGFFVGGILLLKYLIFG